MWFNRKHLAEATKKAARPDAGYFWHFGSLIHAFLPWVLDFKLLEWRIARLKQLKQKLPDDPQLNKVHFDD